MAVHKGKGGSLTFNSGLVAEAGDYSVEISQDTLETTAMGTGNSRTYTNGLHSWSGSASFKYDAADATGQGALLANAIGNEGGKAVSLVLHGDGGTSDTITGTAIVTAFSINGSADGLVEASISFQGSGEPILG